MILVIGILMLAFGIRLSYTLDCDKEDIGTEMSGTPLTMNNFKESKR